MCSLSLQFLLSRHFGFDSCAYLQTTRPQLLENIVSNRRNTGEGGEKDDNHANEIDNSNNGDEEKEYSHLELCACVYYSLFSEHSYPPQTEAKKSNNGDNTYRLSFNIWSGLRQRSHNQTIRDKGKRMECYSAFPLLFSADWKLFLFSPLLAASISW